MSKIQMIFGLLLFLIILFSMNMIFYESFTTSSPSPSDSSSSVCLNSNKLNDKPKNDNKIYSRLSTQNQNDDQPLCFGFS
jgi:hypothetical protein